MSGLFTGLCAFPLTPADADGIVDVDAIARHVDRLANAGVDSIGLLGSTGGYAYLDRAQRHRAAAAAIEAVAGRVPVMVGVSSLRTTWALELAREAERLGADALLLAPMSYIGLTHDEVAGLYRTVAGSTGLPLCIYNNPGTTRFIFTDELIAELATVPGIAAIKMPLPADRDFAGELSRLRGSTPAGFGIGYSGDWGAADALLAGADAWYSVAAGLLPHAALRLTRAAQTGQASEVAAAELTLAPLWALFRAHGSPRIMYAIAELLGLSAGDPPLPLQRISPAVLREVEQVTATLAVP